MAVSELEVISEKTPERLHIEMPRRAFLLKLGFLLNGVAATMVSVPLLGYLLSAFRNDGGFTSWISLGSLATFPENQTRMAKFRNPYTRPWDGETADIPCWVRRMEGEKFQIFAINCTHLGCPVRWFQESHLKPAHRTPKMSAVDGEDLKLFAFHSPHPAGNVGGLAVPWSGVRIAEFRHAGLVLGERCERAE